MAFDDLREKLLLGGVAPRHVRRYLRELREHLDDLTAQQRAAGYDDADARLRARARLGDDEELAAAMLAQKQFHSWAARAPWAVFLLLPPVITFAMVLVFHSPLLAIGKYYGFLEMRLVPQWFQFFATAVVTTANWTILPSAAALFVAIAARQRLKLIWPLAATLVVLMLVVHGEVLFAAHQKGHLSVGVGLALLPQAWAKTGENWFQIAARYVMTILPLLWLWRRRLARS